jgi:anti-sigma B factor antagonist
MSHRLIERSDAVVVQLAGDVDLDSSPAARKVLLDALQRSRPVFVDLSAVTYIDSSGIASLIEAFQRARTMGVQFMLTDVAEPVMRVLSLARLDRVLPIDNRPHGGLQQSSD